MSFFLPPNSIDERDFNTLLGIQERMKKDKLRFPGFPECMCSHFSQFVKALLGWDIVGLRFQLQTVRGEGRIHSVNATTNIPTDPEETSAINIFPTDTPLFLKDDQLTQDAAFYPFSHEVRYHLHQIDPQKFPKPEP